MRLIMRLIVRVIMRRSVVWMREVDRVGRVARVVHPTALVHQLAQTLRRCRHIRAYRRNRVLDPAQRHALWFEDVHARATLGEHDV